MPSKIEPIENAPLGSFFSTEMHSIKIDENDKINNKCKPSNTNEVDEKRATEKKLKKSSLNRTTNDIKADEKLKNLPEKKVCKNLHQTFFKFDYAFGSRQSLKILNIIIDLEDKKALDTPFCKKLIKHK